MLMSHARNGDEFRTPRHCGSPANIEVPAFVILVNPKLVWNSWNLACFHGAASTCRGKNFVLFGAGLGIYFSQTRASHNKHHGFGRERPTFGDETISTASYCFQIFSSVNIEQQECCVNFCDFLGFVWTFLCINRVFNAFMCIIQIWTTCTCSSAYKLVEKIKSVSLGACLGPMQEMGMNFKHQGTVDCRQNFEMPGF